MNKNITLFDLDNTLISGDSDYAWCCFLINQLTLKDSNHKSTSILHHRNKEFLQVYEAGNLDMGEWLGFLLGLMSQHPIKKLLALQKIFMSETLVPMVAPAARTLIEQHRKIGDTLVLITATNDFVARPIAKYLNINHLIATRAEQHDGYLNGKTIGSWSFREGKLTRLQEWLNQYNATLEHSTAYSDSHNDLPLLKAVDTPVAVNPDPILLAHAREQQWRVISLRTSNQIHDVQI